MLRDQNDIMKDIVEKSGPRRRSLSLKQRFSPIRSLAHTPRERSLSLERTTRKD